MRVPDLYWSSQATRRPKVLSETMVAKTRTIDMASPPIQKPAEMQGPTSKVLMITWLNWGAVGAPLGAQRSRQVNEARQRGGKPSEAHTVFSEAIPKPQWSLSMGRAA
jgi:hypothetical protein